MRATESVGSLVARIAKRDDLYRHDIAQRLDVIERLHTAADHRERP